MSRTSVTIAAVALAVGSIAIEPARADQGGVSFWLPGGFGSLAATPVQPGWSFGSVYIHSSVSAGGDVAASRAIRFQNATANLRVNLDAQLKANVDVVLLSPGYTFATPMFGGQFTSASSTNAPITSTRR
jgi:hypothetical protein